MRDVFDLESSRRLLELLTRLDAMATRTGD